MWSRRSAIERCPSPWNQIHSCPTVTDKGQVKGTDILLKQILCSTYQKSVNIIALHLPLICYCWAWTYLVSRRRASLDHRSTTPHVAISQPFAPNFKRLNFCECFEAQHLREQICINFCELANSWTAAFEGTRRALIFVNLKILHKIAVIVLKCIVCGNVTTLIFIK